MAIEAVIRKLLAGTRPASGARSGTHALTLADYEALFAGRAIYTGFRDDDADLPLYRQLLGTTFAALPPSLQALHGSPERRRWSGYAEVRRGRGLFARLVGAMLGFPNAASRIPVTVTFEPGKESERWTRDFGGRIFSSVQSRGGGRDCHLLVERFGIARFALGLVVEGERLLLVPRRWSILRIPMPRALLPDGESFESDVDGSFCFDVTISAPLIGLIVAYRGTLAPEPPAA